MKFIVRVTLAIHNHRFIAYTPPSKLRISFIIYRARVLPEQCIYPYLTRPEHEAKLVAKSIYPHRNRAKNYRVLHQLIKTPSFSPIFHTLVSPPPSTNDRNYKFLERHFSPPCWQRCTRCRW